MPKKQTYKLDRVAIRMVKEPPLYSSRPIESPDDVIRLMNETLRQYDREVLCVVNFRNDYSPINMNIVSMGTLNASLAHPREILKSTILSNAAAVMLVHNHPSGNLALSDDDVRITERMQKLFSLAEIQFLDHIIVGNRGEYFSFRENEILPGQKEWPSEITSGSVISGASVQEAAAKKEDRIKAITDKLEAGIQELFDSEKYKAYLSTMAKFHNYSLNNTILIAMQKPDATLVAGYQAWQKKHGRHVKKGEKGIQIIAPSPYKVRKEREVMDASGRPKLDAQGNPMKETVEVEYPSFRVATVFDVSQTEGKELPSLAVDELTGQVQGYERMLEALEAVCPVPIGFEQIASGAKGYFHTVENRIALQEGMSEIQTVKTLVHEMAHQKLHSHEKEKPKEERLSSRSKEVEAESVAYTICQHFGIDTADYSFGYIAGWSSGRETAELKESLGKIRNAASEMITEIEGKLMEMAKAEELERIPEQIDGPAGEKDGQLTAERPSVLEALAGSRKEAEKAKTKETMEKAPKRSVEEVL